MNISVVLATELIELIMAVGTLKIPFTIIVRRFKTVFIGDSAV